MWGPAVDAQPHKKPADTVLLYYLFRDDFSDDVRRRGYEYYEPRTAHCSSLSRSIYPAHFTNLKL
ncbi:MAG: hypothetical protein ACOCSQ_06055 [Planctomycetota bacterium]